MSAAAILGLLGSGLAVGGSVGSNIFANQTNREIAEQTNRTNLEINSQQLSHADQAATEAYARQRQLYTDFYSPQALVNQYKNAGLSVGMMYGTGGTGGSGSTSVNQANTPRGIPQQMYEQKNILDAQTALLSADAMKKAAETEEIKTKAAKNIAELPEIQQNIEESKKRVEEITQSIKESQQKVDNMVAEKLNIIADTAKKGEETKTEQERQKLIAAQTEYNQSLKQLTEIKINWEEKISEATVDQIKAQTKQLRASANKLNIEANILNEQKKWLIQKAEEEALMSSYNRQYLQPKQYKQLEALIAKASAEAQRAAAEGHSTSLSNKVYDDLNELMPGLGSSLKVVFTEFIAL